MDPNDHRSSWDEYFMKIAETAASRATCNRKHVGAVLVRDRRVIATGYNGSIPGTEHCWDDNHLMVFDAERGGESCVRTVHAESNAIAQAARFGIGTEGATIYTTASPCWNCFKLIAAAGVKRIVFGVMYRDLRIYDFAKKANIELVDLTVMSDGKAPVGDITDKIHSVK